MGKDSLGEFELMVLLAALRLGEEEAYSLAIADDIRTRTGRIVRRSAVRVTLKRLEAKGLVTTWLGPPRAERGGKGRRLVRVEPIGRSAVYDARSALERMWRDLPVDPKTAR